MQRTFISLPGVLLVIGLAACNTAGTTAVPPGTASAYGTDRLIAPNLDPLHLDGSPLLAMLASDAGYQAAEPSSVHPLQKPAPGPYVTQVSGGNLTVARVVKGDPNAYNLGVGFLSTFRNSSDTCDCENGSKTFPPPFATTVTNPKWGASPFDTLASSTALGQAYSTSKGACGASCPSANTGGAYTFDVTQTPPGQWCGSGHSPCTATVAAFKRTPLARQSAPVVTTGPTTTTIAWTPVSGSKEYFVALLTENNACNPSKTPLTVGFTITNKTSVTYANSVVFLCAGHPYQALLLDSDALWIAVYCSEGGNPCDSSKKDYKPSEAPGLPPYIDFSLSSLTTFTPK